QSARGRARRRRRHELPSPDRARREPRGAACRARARARAGLGFPSTEKKKRHAGGNHRQAKPLAHGETEREEAEERIWLRGKLAHRARNAVADEKERAHLHARPRARREPPEEREERHALERELVELRRVAGSRAGLAKHHTPGRVGDAAPQLAIDEVAQAPG